MHDSLSQSAGTVLEADFYHADQLLPQSDEDLVAKVSHGLHDYVLFDILCAMYTQYSAYILSFSFW